MDEWPGNMDLRNLLLYLLIHTMAPFSRGSLVSLFTPNSAPTLVTRPARLPPVSGESQGSRAPYGVRRMKSVIFQHSECYVTIAPE